MCNKTGKDVAVLWQNLADAMNELEAAGEDIKITKVECGMSPRRIQYFFADQKWSVVEGRWT